MRFLFLALTLTFALTSAYGQTTPARLKIEHLRGDFYVYTTYNTYQGDQTPAHGMYLVTADGVALFDTPWDTTQFQPLLDSIKTRHHQNVVMCLATHWHSDRTEGLEYYKQQGIKTYTTARTDALSKQNHKKRAEFLLANDTTFTLGHYAFDTYYPGEGHTLDNIVVWFKQEKILYGGCLIKGAEAENLGYLGDGNEAAYATTLKRVRDKYPHPQFILVSHHDWRNRKSLKHSIKLAKRLRAKKPRALGFSVFTGRSESLG